MHESQRVNTTSCARARPRPFVIKWLSSMSRIAVLVAVVVGSCTTRSLDVTDDLGGATMGEVDLASPIAAPLDLARPSSELVVLEVGNPDLAMNGRAPGVPCGTVTCAYSEFCCVPFSGAMIGPESCEATDNLACAGPGWGPGKNAVQFQCDGPEDCPAGEVCMAEGGLGQNDQISSSRCMSMAGTDDNGVLYGGVICHSTLDCPVGKTCVPGQWILDDANGPDGVPPIGYCQ